MNEDIANSHRGDLRSFGRKRGRKLSPLQDRLLQGLLPKLAIDLSSQPAPSEAALLAALGTGAQSEVWLEIGFGGAEHLIWQAEHNPSVRLLGSEPFQDGVVKALAEIEKRKLVNVGLHADDVRPLLRWLPEASLSQVFILFPDPWPKRRHQKRRLLSKPLLDMLARTMKSGAELHFATDIGDYVRSALLAIMSHPEFAWQARSPQDWRQPPADWPGTRYEAKAIREGRKRYFFKIRRL